MTQNQNHDKTIHPAQGALHFVSTGVGCFALALVHSVGIVTSLIEIGYFSEDELKNDKKFKNLVAIRASLLSLCLFWRKG